ncbi:MAG: hypothetical protein PHI12_08390 [Dehalococcoidales bacterium]|nr:hypothetical protein [Dehalococcoidales bacterium]
MSGCGYNGTCPNCGADMDCYSDWKPFDTNSGECLECGFHYWTSEDYLTLEEVNERRAELDREPLTELKKGVESCQA